MRGKKGKNGAKKYGRNKLKCEQYSREKRREKNKVLRVKRHLKRHPLDLQSASFI